jgi:DNA repair photolyase
MNAELIRRFRGDVTSSWNPITGCLHGCIYCWARRYASRLAEMGVEPYRTKGFQPSFVEERLRRTFGKDEFIFVSDMGDMWGEWVPEDWIRAVLKCVRRFRATFFFLTKNPRRYHEFLDEIPRNSLLGATIESNLDHGVTKAPSVRDRYLAMKNLNYPYKSVVIEPILEFDEGFLDWIREIKPITVYVGYDNYGNRLPEPPRKKTLELIKRIREFTHVSTSLQEE